MKPGSPETIVDVRIIIMFKYLCYFDTIVARQAIFSIRAGDRNYPVVFLPDFIDEIQLFLGKHGGTGSAGAIEIFKDMLHGGHAAEHYAPVGFSRRRTEPVLPSISTSSPSCSQRVAPERATTAGIPS